jgi:hypothetical protein
VSSPGLRLPDFFIIGAQKSGTTSLHRYLQRHPDVFLSDPKEPHFFSRPGDWPQGEEGYRALFAGAGTAKAVGEASTTYTMYPFYPEVPERLTKLVARPRLIYLLRDPVDRMRSAYQHALAGGVETRPLDLALRADPRYLLTSSYSLQLERWLARVPRERILLLDFDRLLADPIPLINQTLAFLGVDEHLTPEVPAEAFNPSSTKRAPRTWWRLLGEGLRRAEAGERLPRQVTASERLARAAVRLDESRRPIARRPISPAEVTVSEPLQAELRRALADDLRRLRAHWDAAPIPSWL